jgi:hypothetical protein
MMIWKWLRVSVIAAAAAAAVSCGSSSNLPKPGSPGFYWAAANATHRSGDFVKTGEELQRILVGESEFTARARAWDMVVSGGLAQGYSALSDVYEAGARANRQNPLPYRKRVSELRTLSGNMAIQLAEDVHKYLEQSKDPAALLMFPFPAGSVNDPPSLVRVNKGLFVQDSEQVILQTAMLQRGVLLSLCEATGNPGDPAKTQQLFLTTEVKVPREVFLMAAAKRLYEASDIYGDKKLDLPNKFKIISIEALAALKAIPESKETKALTEKIQKAMKKARLDGV